MCEILSEAAINYSRHRYPIINYDFHKKLTEIIYTYIQ